MSMHYLTLDTNTWIYLANGTEPVRLLSFIKQEVNKGNITILLPDIIVKEWNKNKDKAVKQGGLKHFKDVNEAFEKILKLLGEKGERDVFSFLLDKDDKKDYFKDFVKEFKNKKKEIEVAITENIKLIDDLFKHKTTKVIRIKNKIFLEAGQFALDRKAPFRNRNSFADALIVFSFLEFVNSKGIEGAMFITYNTEDFCEKKEGKKNLHPDLEPDFTKSKSKFYTIVGVAINTIEKDIVSKEELEFIKQWQDEAERDIEYCQVCSEINNWNNEVYFYGSTDIIDGRKGLAIEDQNQTEFEFAKDLPKIKPEMYHNTIEVGHCNWCNTEHFKCVICGLVNALWDHEYNDKKECEGCGLIYFVEKHYDQDGIDETTYKILNEKDICDMCGNEFESRGDGSNICENCMNE